MAALGWHNRTDTQGQDDQIREVMQKGADEYEDVASFEQALDSARIPLGTVKRLVDAVQEDWAVHRKSLVDVDVNGEARPIPRAPARFSQAEVGPRRGAYLRGADNRAVLKDMLGLDDASIDKLEKGGVLLSETFDA